MAIKTNEKLVSIREAAIQCGRSMETIRRWIWSGKLPAQKLGNQLFVKRHDLQVFCERYQRPKRQATTLLEFLEKAKVLREQIRQRTGISFDVTKLVEESRKGLL